jgi:hypothetical protein
MAVTKPKVNELRTPALIQTNLNKQYYGSTKTGAGYLDGYVDFKTVHGKYYQRKGQRALATGAVLDTYDWVFICRFSTDISNIVDPQMRFTIKGKTHTLDSFDAHIWDRNEFFIFYLKEFK